MMNRTNPHSQKAQQITSKISKPADHLRQLGNPINPQKEGTNYLEKSLEE